MTRRQFYLRWLRECFGHLGRTDLFSGIIGVLLPFLSFLVPSLESHAKDLVWQIPLTVFTAIGLVRAVIAPFVIYKERDVQATLAEQASHATNGVRALLSLFSDKKHYREEQTGLRVWKLGVKNSGKVPARCVSLWLDSCEPIGADNKQQRSEACGRAHGIPLGRNHMVGESPVFDTLCDEGLFDLIEVASGVGPLILCHARLTKDRKRDPTGTLPRGKYKVTVRAEAENADSAYFSATVSIAKDGKIKLDPERPPQS